MATAAFSKYAGVLRAALSQHYLLGFEIASTGIPAGMLFQLDFQFMCGYPADLEHAYFISEMNTVSNEEIILLFSRLHPSTAFQSLLLTMMATLFLLRDSCPQ